MRIITSYFFIIRTFLPAVVLLLLVQWLSGCSAERKNLISKTYHNTTARYNAYFYARNSIEEIREINWNSHENNYNKILRIYPELDSVLAETYKEETEDAIQKASIAIERHKNSKWVDDSYVLVGLARYYDLDYRNAIETFKFVNKNGEDDAARHEALAYLIRTYTDALEYQNAVVVSDYLKKEDIAKSEQKIVYLNRAYMYQVGGDMDNMLKNLVEAAPLLKKKDGKGRIYFIIGQIYAQLGFEAEAYSYYKRCISSNPEYELDFMARLNMTQVAEIDKASDVRAARKVFSKLLRDRKNKEFKDRIYYEMGEFESRQGNTELAIDNYKESLRYGISNRQRGMSYLRLGQIYYDSLKEYELAQAYYDSTISVLPEDVDNYDDILTRQQVLADFVEQINTIALQDSLLSLADRDSSEVREQFMAMLREEARLEEERAREMEERMAARRTNFSLANNETGFSVTSWYFGNPSAVAQGQAEFRRIWGDRPLEDHWRRSSKQVLRDYNQPGLTETEGVADTDTPEATADPEAGLRQKAQSMMMDIPYSEEQKMAALVKIENALYRLGNIYNFELEEDNNAAVTFESLLARFPQSEYTPEVLYQLYLIYEQIAPEKKDGVRERLTTDFRNTRYAKLILNPNYTKENSEANEKLKQAYSQAYSYYKNEEYGIALAKADSALAAYPESSYAPKVALLKILIHGRNESKNTYENRLEAFLEQYPDVEEADFARQLLNESQSFSQTPKAEAISFLKNLQQEHYFIALLDTNKEVTDGINENLDLFNKLNYAATNLDMSNLILESGRTAVLVGKFKNGETAYDYLKKIENNHVIDSEGQRANLINFVIGKDNFDILYQTKDLQSYLKFFNKTYGDGS